MRNKFLKILFIVLFAAFTLGFLTGAVAEFSLSKDYKVVSEVYTVKQGDTFMDICLEYRKRDERDPYIFVFMDEIRALNPAVAKNKSQLSIGDELKIQYKVSK